MILCMLLLLAPNGGCQLFSDILVDLHLVAQTFTLCARANFKTAQTEVWATHQGSSRTMPQLASPFLGIVNFLELLRDETIAIGHLNLRQNLGVDHVIFFDDIVAKEHEGRKRINLVHT